MIILRVSEKVMVKWELRAGMAELADAPDLGSGG